MRLFGLAKRTKHNNTTELCGLINEGSYFEGVLIFEGTLRIDGALYGKVICKPGSNSTLIIGSQGRVEVELLCVDNLQVAGHVYSSGPIIALESASFHGESRVEVDKSYALYSSSLQLKNKALFQGKSVSIRHEAIETKDNIKSLVHANRNKTISLPINQNPLLQAFEEQD